MCEITPINIPKNMKKDDFPPAINKKFDEYMRPNWLACVYAPTTGGKTTLALKTLNLNGNFDDLYIFCKDPDEEIYRYVKKKLGDRCIISDDMNELPEVQELDENKQHMIIFDDVLVVSKKEIDKMTKFFSIGRKHGCSMWLLTQNFFSVPPKIRRQITHMFIFKLRSIPDLMKVLREFSISGDGKDKETKEYNKKLLDMYNTSLTTPENNNGFFMINLKPGAKYMFNNNLLSHFENF